MLLIRRSATMRSHAGQVAFPGGATDPQDASATATALREATEEVGLVADTVDVLAELPALWLPPSGFVVTPVIGYWHSPHPVGVVDEAEVASVHRVPLSELVLPANRFLCSTRPASAGRASPSTACSSGDSPPACWTGCCGSAGWEQPWDRQQVRPLPD